jgi:hypothetical protein
MSNLSSSTVVQLKELARQHNIPGRSAMKKAALITALERVMPRRATTPPSSSSSSTSSATRRNRTRHTLIIEFWPKIFGGPRPQDPRNHMQFLLTWFRRAVQLYLLELNEDIGTPIDPNDPHGRRDCRLEGIYGSTRTGNMYVKLSYTGPVIPRERLINDEDTTSLDQMLDPDEDGNYPLVIPRPVRGRRSSTPSSDDSESGSASVERYLIRGNEHVEIVDRLPTGLMQDSSGGSGTMDMSAMEAALEIPVEQFRLADIIDNNLMMADPGIRGGLRNISHQLRNAAFTANHFKEIQKQVKKIFRNPMVPIPESDENDKSSSSKKKSVVGKRGRSKSLSSS